MNLLCHFSVFRRQIFIIVNAQILTKPFGNLVTLAANRIRWDFLLVPGLGNANVQRGRAAAAVWPDWAIYCTLGNFKKPMAAIICPNLQFFLGNFCKGVKIYHFEAKSFLGNVYRHLAIFSGHTKSGRAATTTTTASQRPHLKSSTKRIEYLGSSFHRASTRFESRLWTSFNGTPNRNWKDSRWLSSWG